MCGLVYISQAGAACDTLADDIFLHYSAAGADLSKEIEPYHPRQSPALYVGVAALTPAPFFKAPKVFLLMHYRRHHDNVSGMAQFMADIS